MARKYSLKVLNRMDYMCNQYNQQCYGIGKDYQKYISDYGHVTIAGCKAHAQYIDEINWLKYVR